MAGSLAAELAGAFGEPNPYALLVDLDDLAAQNNYPRFPSV